jgi:hypothetical protein
MHTGNHCALFQMKWKASVRLLELFATTVEVVVTSSHPLWAISARWALTMASNRAYSSLSVSLLCCDLFGPMEMASLPNGKRVVCQYCHPLTEEGYRATADWPPR